jgi:cysteinyl-tRNA synthetase
LRLLVLQSHYRTQSKFSWDELAAAQERLKDIYRLAALRWQATSQTSSITKDSLATTVNVVNKALANDLNTPAALAALSPLVDASAEGLGANTLDEFSGFLGQLDSALGLNLSTINDITQEQKTLVVKREQARASDNWVDADSLRMELAQQGITLIDTPGGPIWYRT